MQRDSVKKIPQTKRCLRDFYSIQTEFNQRLNGIQQNEETKIRKNVLFVLPNCTFRFADYTNTPIVVPQIIVLPFFFCSIKKCREYFQWQTSLFILRSQNTNIPIRKPYSFNRLFHNSIIYPNTLCHSAIISF